MSVQEASAALLRAARSWNSSAASLPVREAASAAPALASISPLQLKDVLRRIRESCPEDEAAAAQAICNLLALAAPAPDGLWICALHVPVCAARPAGKESRKWIPVPTLLPRDSVYPVLEDLAALGLERAAVVPAVYPALPVVTGAWPWNAAASCAAASALARGTLPHQLDWLHHLALAAARNKPWSTSRTGRHSVWPGMVPVFVAAPLGELARAIGPSRAVPLQEASALAVARALRVQCELAGPGESVAALPVASPLREPLENAHRAASLAMRAFVG
jgi:hypothetical protein